MKSRGGYNPLMKIISVFLIGCQKQGWLEEEGKILQVRGRYEKNSRDLDAWSHPGVGTGGTGTGEEVERSAPEERRVVQI